MKINKNIIGIFLIIIILLVVSYAFLKLSHKKEEPSLQVINVLDKKLYDDCHIKGSINVPFDKIEQHAKELLEKGLINTHIVLYCSNYMCTASGAAARMFEKMGFKNVWAYEAGMADWHQNNLPVEGNCKESYLNMRIEKSELSEQGIQPITTQELKEKIKEMLKIPGY